MMGTLARTRLNEALGSIQAFMMRKRETINALLQDTVVCISENHNVGFRAE